MPIRSAEQFEEEATRNALHHKSVELKDVIKRLRLYHGDRAVKATLREHLLMDLRHSVLTWQKKHPKEFAARHGHGLLDDILEEVTSSGPEHLPLVNGDVLFRWVPRGVDQRGGLQAVISGAQAVQEDTHRKRLGEGVNLDVSSAVVQHVGVYSDHGVIEIGGGGLGRNPVTTRTHYDLVVRSQTHGERIAQAARSATATGPAYLWALLKYPAWELASVMAVSFPGARLLARDRILLQLDDTQYRQKGQRNVLQQLVICSHFVNAVLYAAIRPGGTLATATDRAYDEIFKVSPAQMWREFMGKQGLWAQTHAVFVGVQHKGRLDRNVDPRLLGVGLRTPPIPKKAGRPPLPRNPSR